MDFQLHFIYRSLNNAKSLISKCKLFFQKELPAALKVFLRNQIVLRLIIASLVVNIANWISIFIFIKPVDETIILHYNVYFGVDMIGNWRQVYLLPLIGLILILINSFLALYFYSQKERIASHILIIASLMTQLSLIIATTSVIIINY
jgi:hypothetical protein